MEYWYHRDIVVKCVISKKIVATILNGNILFMLSIYTAFYK